MHTEYKCLPNYELKDGDLSKVCGDNGTWFGEDPICVGEYILSSKHNIT